MNIEKMIKKILLTVFEPYTSLPWKQIGNILLWSLKLYSLVLTPYLTIIVSSLLFMILTGTGNLYGIVDFTRAYFYDGWFLFTAWRIHLVIFIICLITNINQELR